MKCEKCGTEIDSIEADMFNADGSDDWYTAEIYEDRGVVLARVLPCWTGNGLSEEEQIDTIRCPHCKKYPFKQKMIDACTYVDLIMYPMTYRNE